MSAIAWADAGHRLQLPHRRGRSRLSLNLVGLNLNPGRFLCNLLKQVLCFLSRNNRQVALRGLDDLGNPLEVHLSLMVRIACLLRLRT